jgi:hypothetical protein
MALGVCTTAKTASSDQFAQWLLDKQRLIRCPPRSHAHDVVNEFAHILPYKYSQLTFKTFSDTEIKDQAGRDSLPDVQELGDSARRVGGFEDEDNGIGHRSDRGESEDESSDSVITQVR